MMGQLLPIFWAKQTANDRSGVATCERLVNCFLDPNPENAKAPYKILGTPGLKFWSAFGTGPIRGILPALGRLFVVSGQELYVVSSDKTSSMIGTILGGGPVSMCANATHVWIATNLKLYVATLGTINVVDGNHYSSVAYQDGYGIATLYDSEQFYISGIDDLTTIDPLDFSSADTFPDNALSCLSYNRDVMIFGTESTQHFCNSGAALFPFEANPGGFIEIGCGAAKSPAKLQDVVCWMANDFSVQAMVGNSHKRISTAGVEKWIRERVLPAEARSLTYRQEGHEIYALNFSDGSIAYDLSTDLWHERKSWGENRWRAECYARVFDLDLVADFENGNVYQLDLDTPYEENGVGVVDQLVRVMQASPIHAGGGMRVIMDELFIDCEMGNGIVGAGQGSDPQWMLDWSDDGGKTWSNQRIGTAGQSGQYSLRNSWYRCGSFYQRTPRLTLSDPMKLCVLGGYARIGVCGG